jgi:hypothetical protein
MLKIGGSSLPALTAVDTEKSKKKIHSLSYSPSNGLVGPDITYWSNRRRSIREIRRHGELWLDASIFSFL